MAIDGSGPRKIQKIFADRGVAVSHQQCLLVNALLGRERLVTYGEIAEILWGRDPEGGPLDVDGHIRVTISRTRQKIMAAGIPWTIENCYSIGYRLTYLHDRFEAKRMTPAAGRVHRAADRRRRSDRYWPGGKQPVREQGAP